MQKPIVFPEIPNAAQFSTYFGDDLVLPNYGSIIEPRIEKIKRNYELQLREKDEEISRLRENPAECKVIVVEEIDNITAERRVTEYMRQNKKADLEELFDELHIDMEQLIKILDKLGRQGRIKVNRK